MNLRSYLDTLPRGGVSAFAAKVHTSTVYLSQLAARQQAAGQRPREPSPELSVLIERESGQHVRRWDMRPDDWHLIWPELIGLAGAPPIAEKPQEAKQAA